MRKCAKCRKCRFKHYHDSPNKRQTRKLSVNSDEENRLPFKRVHRVLENLSRRMLVPEGEFEAALFLVNPGRKGLVYLKAQVTVLT